MDYTTVHRAGLDTVLEGARNFCLADILECGQCFRWERAGPDSYTGVALGRALTVSQRGERLVLHGVDTAEFHARWRDYFDLGRDYGDVKRILCADPVMAKAMAFTPGMRVLRQEPWETLCSFIISANNNIARIRGIVERLCALAGEPLGGGHNAFPTPQRLAALTEADLAPARCGYRARYLLDAAQKVASGTLRLDTLYTLPLEEARAQLMTVCGVGVKVAECVLLYGFARSECVPVDVWIRRALDNLYPGGMPSEIRPLAGLGQQYLFHYVRNCPTALDARAV